MAHSPNVPLDNSTATQASSRDTSADDKLANLRMPSFVIPVYGEGPKGLHNMNERQRRFVLCSLVNDMLFEVADEHVAIL